MVFFIIIAFSAFLHSVLAAKIYTRVGLTPFPTGGAAPKAMDWSPTNDKIAFEQIPVPLGFPPYYYDVFTISSDGTGEVCLTCDKTATIGKHNGNACWSPDTDWIVFTAMDPTTPDIFDNFGVPGLGMNTDLYAISSDGLELYRLTSYGYNFVPWSGFLHPEFSHDGSKLFWAFRKEDGLSFSGGWVLRMADWVVDAGVPRLENQEEFAPGDQSCFYESHAFGATNNEIMFSGNLVAGQVCSGMDVYTYDTISDDLTRLTTSDTVWDEHAHWTPDGEKVIYMSSADLGIDPIPEEACNDGTYLSLLRTELWIMNADGSNQERLTYFNTPGHEDFDVYQGAQVVVLDSAISAAGDRVVFALAYNDTSVGTMKTGLYMMDFDVVVVDAASVSSCSILLVGVLLFFMAALES